MESMISVRRGAGDAYRRALWGTMDRLGIDESLW